MCPPPRESRHSGMVVGVNGMSPALDLDLDLDLDGRQLLCRVSGGTVGWVGHFVERKERREGCGKKFSAHTPRVRLLRLVVSSGCSCGVSMRRSAYVFASHHVMLRATAVGNTPLMNTRTCVCMVTLHLHTYGIIHTHNTTTSFSFSSCQGTALARTETATGR